MPKVNLKLEIEPILLSLKFEYFFFSALFIISVIGYIILHYAFRLNDKHIFIINNLVILLLVICSCKEWKNPQLLIYYPVFLILLILFSGYTKILKIDIQKLNLAYIN